MRRIVFILAATTACLAASLSDAPASAKDAAASDAVITKTKAQCAAEYSAHIEAIKANGQSKAAFDADCRAGTEKLEHKPAPVAAAPAPASAKPVDAPALKPSIAPAADAAKP
jgi:hypothetical protein